MTIIKQTELISIFDELVKENRLTKKVILGSKQPKVYLFGQYHDLDFSFSNNVFELSFYKEIPDLDLSNKYLSFKIYHEESDNKFDIYIYKHYKFENFEAMEFGKPFVINVMVNEKEVLIRHKDVIARY